MIVAQVSNDKLDVSDSAKGADVCKRVLLALDRLRERKRIRFSKVPF